MHKLVSGFCELHSESNFPRKGFASETDTADKNDLRKVASNSRLSFDASLKGLHVCRC